MQFTLFSWVVWFKYRLRAFINSEDHECFEIQCMLKLEDEDSKIHLHMYVIFIKKKKIAHYSFMDVKTYLLVISPPSPQCKSHCIYVYIYMIVRRAQGSSIKSSLRQYFATPRAKNEAENQSAVWGTWYSTSWKEYTVKNYSLRQPLLQYVICMTAMLFYKNKQWLTT